MTENASGIPDSQRTDLLRHGVVVLDEQVNGAQRRITVTGETASRVCAVVRELYGEDIEIEVAGPVPRELRPRPCIGQMERDPGRLQLRYALRADEHIDDIVVAEDGRAVVVFATVCTPLAGENGDLCDVPHHVYLDAPLGDRIVIDGTRGVAVPYRNVYANLER